MYGQYSTGRFPSSTALFPVSPFSFLNLLLRYPKSAGRPHKPPKPTPALSLFVELFFLPEKKGCARIRKKERRTNLSIRAKEWRKPFFNDFMPPSAAKGEEVMMYIHYCKYCRRIHILNGHKLYCPACSGKLSELNISYMKYVNLTREERHALKEKCADEKNLRELSVEYRRRNGRQWFQSSDPARPASVTDNKSASRPEYSPHLQVSVS